MHRGTLLDSWAEGRGGERDLWGLEGEVKASGNEVSSCPSVGPSQKEGDPKETKKYRNRVKNFRPFLSSIAHNINRVNEKNYQKVPKISHQNRGVGVAEWTRIGYFE